MAWRRPLYRRLAWLALCAVVFGATAPSLSKTLMAPSPLPWAAICGVDGLTVAIEPDTKEEPVRPTGSDVHCGYCVLQQHSPMLPSAAPVWETPSLPPDLLKVSGSSTLFKRLSRDAHLARAPPSFS